MRKRIQSTNRTQKRQNQRKQHRTHDIFFSHKQDSSKLNLIIIKYYDCAWWVCIKDSYECPINDMKLIR